MTAAEALPMTQKVVTGTIATLMIYFVIVVLYFSLNFWQNCLFELSLSHSFHASICILMPDPLKGVDSIAYTHIFLHNFLSVKVSDVFRLNFYIPGPRRWLLARPILGR